jgi:mannose-6-phosphate isomerase-like protein (cupin superfamily)
MKYLIGLVAFLIVGSATCSYVVAAQQKASTAKTLGATYISAADIQARQNEGAAAGIARPNVRVADVGGYNVGVDVISRLESRTRRAAVHFKVTEVLHVMDGTATLVTGGIIVDAKTRPADDLSVKLEDGPGGYGTSIKGGVSQRIKPGDVIIIPAGVPHWFSEINGSLTYIVVRFDPNRLLPSN